MEEVDRWMRFGFVIGSVLISALFLYGALSNDIGKLHDEVKRLRAERPGLTLSATCCSASDGRGHACRRR